MVEIDFQEKLVISTVVSSVLVLIFLLDIPVGPRLSIAPPPRQPIQTTETGLVVLEVSIDATGEPSRIGQSQGMPPFVEPSIEAVRNWRFQALKKGEMAAPATAVMLFRARTVLPDRPYALEMPPGSPTADGPPQPTKIVDPGYPAQSVAEGVVILQMEIDASGRVHRTDIVTDVPSLTRAAAHAASQWKFKPALHGGKPVAGTVIAAISFLRPVLTH